MGWMIVRDDSIWFKHINDAPDLIRRAESLGEEEPLDLIINGRPARFLRMKRGRDGRPTPGLKPSAGSVPFWKHLQQHRGERISIHLAPAAIYRFLPFVAHIVVKRMGQ